MICYLGTFECFRFILHIRIRQCVLKTCNKRETLSLYKQFSIKKKFHSILHSIDYDLCRNDTQIIYINKNVFLTLIRHPKTNETLLPVYPTQSTSTHSVTQMGWWRNFKTLPKKFHFPLKNLTHSKDFIV